MIRRGRLLLLVVPFLLAGISHGAAEVELAGLSDYLEFAALHNAGLQAAFDQWKSALEDVPQAEALADPKFTYAYFIEEVETRVGPQKQKFGISQAFPWFGKIELRTDAAASAAGYPARCLPA